MALDYLRLLSSAAFRYATRCIKPEACRLSDDPEEPFLNGKVNLAGSPKGVLEQDSTFKKVGHHR